MTINDQQPDKPVRMAIARGLLVDGSLACAALLPDNYHQLAHGTDEEGHWALIAGYDHLGWTLEDYVIPRLATGLCFVTELVLKPRE